MVFLHVYSNRVLFYEIRMQFKLSVLMRRVHCVGISLGKVVDENTDKSQPMSFELKIDSGHPTCGDLQQHNVTWFVGISHDNM